MNLGLYRTCPIAFVYSYLLIIATRVGLQWSLSVFTNQELQRLRNGRMYSRKNCHFYPIFTIHLGSIWCVWRSSFLLAFVACSTEITAHRRSMRRINFSFSTSVILTVYFLDVPYNTIATNRIWSRNKYRTFKCNICRYPVYLLLAHLGIVSVSVEHSSQFLTWCWTLVNSWYQIV